MNSINKRFQPDIAGSDPTLHFFMREARMDYSFLDHQVSIKCAAASIAIGQWLDRKYPTHKKKI